MEATLVPALFGGIAGWAADVIDAFGYVGVAALLALESVFPPLPSEVILPLAGFLAGQGRFWLPAVIVAATIGSVVGALVLYGLGAWLGETRLRRLLERYGTMLRLSGRELDRADRWFDRHGGAAVLIGRLVPIVRSIVSIPAGIRRMSLGRVVAYTAAGSAVWNGVLIGLGWAFGEHWDRVNAYAPYAEGALLAGLAACIVWLCRRRRRA